MATIMEQTATESKPATMEVAPKRRGISLHMAVKCNNLEVAKILLSVDPNVNALNIQNWTPLHVAVNNKSKEMVQLLLDNGVDVNPKSYKTKSPLYMAVENNSVEIAEMLLNAGALVKKAYHNDIMTFELASKAANGKMRSLLIRHAEKQIKALDRFPSVKSSKEIVKCKKKEKRKTKLKKSLLYALLMKDKQEEHAKTKRERKETLLRITLLKKNTKLLIKRNLSKNASKYL